MKNDLGQQDLAKTAFTINIADLIYRIEPLFQSTSYFCKNYISSGDPDIRISITKDEIIQEEKRGKIFFYTCEEYIGGSLDRRIINRRINENCVETVVLFRKVLEASLAFDTFFLHGAVIALEDRAYMFTAPSGTGKTTHIMKWLKALNKTYVVNGDKPLIKIMGSQVMACGTPWCGKENMGKNTMVPLRAIIYMERAENNYIEEISFPQIYPNLLQETYLPDDPEKAKKTLDLISQLYEKVRFYKFKCNNFKDDCFDVAYNALVRSCRPYVS